MPEYLYPGVYIEEIPRGPRPIEGVPTSTAAILGEAERGSITPRLVTSYKDYQRWFGDAFDPDKYLPHSLNGFFENGGTRTFICRLVGKGAVSAAATFGSFIIHAAGPGAWGNRVRIKISDGTTKKPDGTSAGFRVQLAYWSTVPAADFDPFVEPTRKPRPQQIEDFDDLDTDVHSPSYYGKRMDNSALALFLPTVGEPVSARPANGTLMMSGGADDPAPLGAEDFAGLRNGGRASEQGLAALELDPYREVALVYAPAATSTHILTKIVAHCEKMRFRFAVIDSDKGLSNPSQLNPRDTLGDSSYAAFYYPWLMTPDPRTGAPKLTPPGGYVLGIYARTDTERGVFKAPANEIVRGALSLEVDINDRIQESLNPKGVNAIRSLPGRGIRVWGARTLTSDPLWKYISVRRLFIFLERSIYEGTQWVVFEPNDERLWARVTDTIRLFLRTQWRLGALLGRTEDEAFFIRCDPTTMTQDDILNGRLICEIGIAPVRPAEFVIFRIFQHTAESQR
jgi:phage tail sheath protein FI